MELRRIVHVVNDQGLHARPCHAFVSACLGFQSAIQVRCRDRWANGKSILEMMTLGAAVDDELELRASGPDAQGLIDALVALVGRGFGESLAP